MAILLIGFDTDRFDWRARRSTTPAVAMKVYEDHPPDFEIRKGPIVCGAARPYPSNAQATRAGQDICSCDLQPIAENLMANPPGLPARPGVRKV